MGLRVTSVYKRKETENEIKKHMVDHLEISFIQKIDEKNTFTKKLMDKIDYLNVCATKGKIEVQNFANEVFINGTIKVNVDTQKVVDEIVNCLNALESFKNKEE